MESKKFLNLDCFRFVLRLSDDWFVAVNFSSQTVNALVETENEVCFYTTEKEYTT